MKWPTSAWARNRLSNQLLACLLRELIFQCPSRTQFFLNGLMKQRVICATVDDQMRNVFRVFLRPDEIPQRLIFRGQLGRSEPFGNLAQSFLERRTNDLHGLSECSPRKYCA